MQFAPIDLPFLPPPDTVLDIPVPPSINRTRKVNWAERASVERWTEQADKRLLVSGQYRAAKQTKPDGPFELTIIADERQCRCDLDNITKHGIDYLKRIELIKDDSPKYMRRLVAEWGVAPEGCRLVIRPAEVRP